MLDTLLKEKTTILLCIIGAVCVTVLAGLRVVDGNEALNAILMALGIGGGRQVLSGIQRSGPPTG